MMTLINSIWFPVGVLLSMNLAKASLAAARSSPSALYREWRQKGLTLALPDLTVAAVAITNGLQLATDNPKDYPMSELRLYPLL